MTRGRPRKHIFSDMFKVVLAYLLGEQHNKCAICGDPIDTITGNIDHDHTTDVIRGALCTCCNVGLGMFKDNVKLLEAAIHYLKEHKINPRSEEWKYYR